MARFKKYGIDAEIDDEMIPVIDALNKLGCKTKFCCSGHGTGQHAYISFDLKSVTAMIDRDSISLYWFKTN